MKAIKLFVLIALLLSCLTSCLYNSFSTTDVKDFNKIYESYADSYGKEPALGFGEYHYGSYFGAFPRSAPDGLSEFYYYHDSLYAWDEYIIYFVYHLEQDKFSDFSQKLSEFKIEYNGKSNIPIYDITHFQFPTYIFTLSKTDRDGNYKCAEYIMLDNINMNVINVYTYYSVEKRIKENCKYDILPNTKNWGELIPAARQDVIGDFSVYTFSNEDKEGNVSYIVPDISEIQDQFLFAD